MKVTRSQKIYLAVMGVGLCALLWDKSFGSAVPAAGDLLAGVASAISATDPPPAAPIPADPATAVYDANVATRLSGLVRLISPNHAARDGFLPAAAWNIGGATSAEPGELGRKFQKAHILKAVVQGRRGQAMVDSNLIAVGQAVDGFKLLSVERMRAIFGNGYDSVELSLEPNPLAAPLTP